MCLESELHLLIFLVVTLWRRGSTMPCKAMSPIHHNLALHGSLLWVLCVPYCCGWAAFSFSLLICNGCPSCLGQCFIPVLLVGQAGASLGLSWIKAGICWDVVAPNFRAFSLCCPLRSLCWGMRPEPPAHFWVLYHFPVIYESVSVPILYCFDYYSFVVYTEI